MNKNLLNPETQRFIEEHYKDGTISLLFKGSPFASVTAQELAIQISGKQKAEKKLPKWFKNPKILYPPTLNLEQTSSEITAEYKASLVKGEMLADLTGGFGIDSFFFSEKMQQVYHIELNPELSEVAAHNFKVLGAQNIFSVTGDSLEFLKNTSQQFDWLFIDPSRRDNDGGRVSFLEDCIPNVPKNLDFLFQKSENILLKTSPLLDISAGISALKNVAEIHIIAVKNDVKELLWILKKEASEEIKVKTVNFKDPEDEVFETTINKNASAEIIQSSPLSYLYEPNAALMKSGMFGSLAEFFQIKKLHVNSHLFTSEEKIENFPGRKFRIQKILNFKQKELKRGIDFDKANITTRNFPMTVAAIRKQLKLAEGGDKYLFFTTTAIDQKIVLLCEKF